MTDVPFKIKKIVWHIETIFYFADFFEDTKTFLRIFRYKFSVRRVYVSILIVWILIFYKMRCNFAHLNI